MPTRKWSVKLGAMIVVVGAISVIGRQLPSSPIARAQTSRPIQNATSELNASLFVQDPHTGGGTVGMQVLWIPQPVQKYCLGKTAKQCVAIDYCIRTTDKSVSMCQNLGVDLKRLPAYPPETRPRRVLSVVYFPAAPIKGIDGLRKFFDNAPKGTFDHLTLNSRIKARIKFTRTPEDDQFDLLEFLGSP